MLKLSNVSIAYNDKIVLDSLDLTANKGEIIGVAAPNGTGKTTMFNVMANFVKPDSGHVFFDGKYTYRNEKEELLFIGCWRHSPNKRIYLRNYPESII